MERKQTSPDPMDWLSLPELQEEIPRDNARINAANMATHSW